MKYNRILNLQEEVKHKSIFLFGPRQTGKTFLIEKTFGEEYYYNLLLADVFLKLSQRPQLIREEVIHKKINKPIIIDEVQKLPILLDEVQYLIEKSNLKFILTGSSPRKLKRGSANLLGGRARTRLLFPLVSKEINNFDLIKILNFGSIPSIYNSDEPVEDLVSYCGNYLKEEIQAEGATRKIENFSRFLQTASLLNGELINYEGIASDIALSASTLREYFKILEDTLVGYLVEPFSKTRKRKAISFSKFYFFDIGVSNSLAGRVKIKSQTDYFGKAFEHFIFLEIKAYLSYSKDLRELKFWRTQKSKIEVDFIIGNNTAIEVKGTDMVQEKHLKGLKALSDELKLDHKIVVSMDSKKRIIDNIQILPYQEFLDNLWSGKY